MVPTIHGAARPLGSWPHSGERFLEGRRRHILKLTIVDALPRCLATGMNKMDCDITARVLTRLCESHREVIQREGRTNAAEFRTCGRQLAQERRSGLTGDERTKSELADEELTGHELTEEELDEEELIDEALANEELAENELTTTRVGGDGGGGGEWQFQRNRRQCADHRGRRH